MAHTPYDRAAMDLAGTLAGLPVEERPRRVEELCRHDPVLKARVLALLDELADAPPFAPDPTRRFPADLTPSWFTGRDSQKRLERVGPYRLLGRIGIGGMSEVYEAEQERPRRRVALKLIHPLRMSGPALRRFEFEVEVLGRLEHPGIARVYDAGTANTEYGAQPYFAMELVRGRRLDRWVDATSPDVKKRLRLLIEICEAVQHAHQHGVIHRDLKPSNILVTDDDKPRVLDFGVAAAVASDESGGAGPRPETLHTQTGQIIGTLQYMSPEQAGGDVKALDTRSDVYALGVVAYQLLCDRLPYEVSDKPLPEAVRVIREETPTRLSTIDRSLRGDLETIVFKALAKEKQQRYASPAELAADVQRYLNDEPIAARPPTTYDQLAKFARRNKVLVGAAVSVLLILLAGVTVTSVALVKANRARRAEIVQRTEAEKDAAVALEVSRFFRRMILAAAPEEARGKPVLVRDLLDRSAAALGGQFPDRPLVEASLHYAIGTSYFELGLPEAAAKHYSDALALYRRERGERHHDTLQCVNSLANSLDAMGRIQDAQPLRAEVLAGYRAIYGHDHPDTIAALANAAISLDMLGRTADAEPLFREALERGRRQIGEDHLDTIKLMNNYGAALGRMGRTAEAEVLLRQALDSSSARHGADHPVTISSMFNLTFALMELGRNDEAEAQCRESLSSSERVNGKDHPDTLFATFTLSRVLLARDRPSDARELLRQLLPRQRQGLGNEHPDTIASIQTLGILEQRLGNSNEAHEFMREAVKLSRTTFGADHPQTLRAEAQLTEFEGSPARPAASTVPATSP